MAKEQRGSFDLRVHIRDAKGYVKRSNPYRLIVQNGTQLFERPPGSGVFYDAQNKLVKAPKDYKPADEVSDKEAAERLAAENAILKAQLAKLAEAADIELPEIAKDEEVVEAKAEVKAEAKKK